MNTFILIVGLYSGAAAIPGYDSLEACEAAATEVKSKLTFVSTVCINGPVKHY